MVESFLKKKIHWILFLLFVSVPVGRAAVDIWTAFGFLLGLYFLLKSPRDLFDELKQNRFWLLYLLIFIPVIISAIDSLNVKATLSSITRFIRYFGFGVIALILVRQSGGSEKLRNLMLFYIAFIVLDALSQWAFGYNIFGYNPATVRVKGIFGDKAHLSFYLATLTPIVFVYLLTKLKRGSKLAFIGLLLSIALITFVVFVGGARTGPITLAVSLLLIFIWGISRGIITKPLRIVVPLLGVLAIAGFFVTQTPQFQKRYTDNLIVTEESDVFKVANRFSTNRVAIWEVTLKALPDYWVNGAGVRAFNEVYQAYPSKAYSDYVYQHHAHLHILEVLIEAGIIGLIGYLIALGYLIMRIFTAKEGSDWLMVAFLAMMPINSHVGFYETYWMPLIWGPLAIGLAQAYAADQRNRKEDS